MSWLGWLLWAAVLWFGVHWAYVLVMAAKAALERGELTRYWIVNLLPTAIVGYLLDFAFQFTFGWVMFAETPFRGGLMFSGRVQYHYRYGNGWRRRFAAFWARNLNVMEAPMQTARRLIEWTHEQVIVKSGLREWIEPSRSGTEERAALLCIGVDVSAGSFKKYL